MLDNLDPEVLKRLVAGAGQQLTPPSITALAGQPQGAPGAAPPPTPQLAPPGPPAPTLRPTAPAPGAPPELPMQRGIPPAPTASVFGPRPGPESVAPPKYQPGEPGFNQQRLTELQNSPSGIGGIKHAGARIPLQVLDALGSAFFPAVTMGIPGTEMHHRMLVNQARGNVNQELGAAKEKATTAAQEAEVPLRQAQTENQRAEAEERLQPKQEMEGKTVTTGEGVMAWNPETKTYDKRVGAAPAKEEMEGKTATTDQGVMSWNPETHAYDKRVGGAPSAGTEVIDQAVGGKPHNVLIEKKTGKVIQDLGEKGTKPPTINVNAAANRSDKSYESREKELNALETPISQLSQRFGRLKDTISQGTPQADALIAPELLTVMAGGQGSGLRMNEAEIARIVGGRSHWESLRAAMQKWSTNPETANSITADQRQQIRALVQTVDGKLMAKQASLNDARSRLSQATTEQEHRQIVNETRQAFQKIDAGETGGGGAGGAAPFKEGENFNGHKILKVEKVQ